MQLLFYQQLTTRVELFIIDPDFMFFLSDRHAGLQTEQQPTGLGHLEEFTQSSTYFSAVGSLTLMIRL